MANVSDDTGLEESRLPLLNEKYQNVASIFCSLNPLVIAADKPSQSELKTCTKQTFACK